MYKTGTRLLMVLFVSGALFATACGKGESESNSGGDNASPAVELSGTPAQNMIAVMEMGVNALKNNSANPAGAAAELNSIMGAYNVADLRAASRAAKEAGQGATDAEKAQFKALQDEYKSLATQVGGQDPAAFNAAHAEWSKAWGIN